MERDAVNEGGVAEEEEDDALVGEQLNPNMSQLNPNLNPNLSQLNPNLSQFNLNPNLNLEQGGVAEEEEGDALVSEKSEESQAEMYLKFEDQTGHAGISS
jgi:hypothetical protein